MYLADGFAHMAFYRWLTAMHPAEPLVLHVKHLAFLQQSMFSLCYGCMMGAHTCSSSQVMHLGKHSEHLVSIWDIAYSRSSPYLYSCIIHYKRDCIFDTSTSTSWHLYYAGHVAAAFTQAPNFAPRP